MLVYTILLSFIVSSVHSWQIQWTQTNLTVTGRNGQQRSSVLKWARNCYKIDLRRNEDTYYNISESDCVRHCHRSEKCVGFNWQLLSGEGACWVGSSLPLSINRAVNQTCGYKPRETQEMCWKHMNEGENFKWSVGNNGVTWATNCHYDSHLEGLQHKNVSHRDDCSKLCADEKHCRSVFWKNRTGECYLIRSISHPQKTNDKSEWCGYSTKQLQEECANFIVEDGDSPTTSTETKSTTATTKEPVTTGIPPKTVAPDVVPLTVTLGTSTQTINGNFNFEASISNAAICIILVIVLQVFILVAYCLFCRPKKTLVGNDTETARFLTPPSYELVMK